MSIPPISTPNPSALEPDCGEQVKALMNEFSEIRGIQSAFNAFMIHDDKSNDELYASLLGRLEKTFEESPKETVDSGVKQLITTAGRGGNLETIEIVMNMLETLINKNVIPA
ncbi:unnamed protein product, partial [Allacma fusca]